MKKVFLLFTMVLSFSFFGQKIKPFYGPFPEPAPNKKMLFYLQRTINRNTLIYEINYDVSGDLNAKEPIKVYWINFEDGGDKSDLTFVQKKFAYGIHSNKSDTAKDVYEITLVSYEHVTLYLKPDGRDKHYHVEVLIKGKMAILEKILIQIIGGNQMNPIVSFIELSGYLPKTGVRLSEKIKPKR